MRALTGRQLARVAQRSFGAAAGCGPARSAWRAPPRRPPPAPAAPPLPAHGAACRCRCRRAPCPRRTPLARTSASTSAPRALRVAHHDLHARPACGIGYGRQARARAAARCRPVREHAHGALPRRRPPVRRRRSRRRRAGRCAPSARRRRRAPCRRKPPRHPAHPALARPRSRRARSADRPATSAVAGRIAQVSTTGLRRRQHRLQEEGGFLQRVGAVRDDDAGHVGAAPANGRSARPACARSRSSCPCCRPAPPARPPARCRRGASSRPAGPSRPPAPPCSRCCRPRLRAAGDGAAGAQNDHAALPSRMFCHRLPTFGNWLKIQILDIQTVQPVRIKEPSHADSPSSLPPASSRFWT